MTIRLTEEEALEVRLTIIDAADAAKKKGWQFKAQKLYDLYMKIAKQGNKRKQPKPGRVPGPSGTAAAS